MPTPLTLDREQLRSLRLASQGFGAAPGTPPTTIVARSGWVRTLGGCDAYLAVRARQRTLRRVELDEAIERRELQVVPAARGCMYLVPRADVPLCLRFAESMSAARASREHTRAGIRAGEVEQVAALALATLQKNGPLHTDALRRCMPEGSVRGLGERGKKVGISSPLPAALRQLEFAGHIERTPEGGRVDTERYLWRPTTVNPLAAAALPQDAVQLHALLLERFLAFAGAATLADFCRWSGLSQRDARAAAAHGHGLPATLPDGEGLTTEAAPDLLRQQLAVRSAAAFLPFEDNLVHLYGGPAHLVDPAALDLEVPSWGGHKPMRLGAALHLSLRGLLVDGQLGGFWEYDPDARLAIPRCFRKLSKAAQVLIEDLSAATTSFLRDDVGHGRSFSLDTDDELRKRLASLGAIGVLRTEAAASPPRLRARPERSAKAGTGVRATVRPVVETPRSSAKVGKVKVARAASKRPASKRVRRSDTRRRSAKK